MRLRQVIVISFFLFFGISNLNFGQDSNTVYYKIWMQSPTSGWDVDITELSSFKEGEGFIIPEQKLPNDYRVDFSMFQDLYDVLAGGYFSIDLGALDKDIILNFYIRNLNKETGAYNSKGEDDNTLFAYFEIEIFELPDSTYTPYSDPSTFPDSSYFSVDTSYYFNEGKYARLVLPKTEKFLNFLDVIGIDRKDTLSFAYLQNKDWDTTDTNVEKTDDWNGYGITIIDSPDSITFKAIHLSRVGGGRGRIHKERDNAVGIKYFPTVPIDFQLEQNYPNPFNPETKIRYSIPNLVRHNNTLVKLDVYNVLGIKVKTLVSENQPAGVYEVSFDASDLASGIYTYSLQNNNFVLTRKMILIK